MAFGFKVARKNNFEFHVQEPILKFSFLEISNKEMENVNKKVQKVSKHTKLWVKNAFDEWKLFHGFNTMKSIIYIL
jgi:hypothetical protein